MFGRADPQSLSGRCQVLKRRYHLHAPGLVYVATMLLLAFGAINSQNNLLFAAFGLAMGGILVSGVVSGAMLMALELRAEPPREAQAGVPLRLRYTLRNRSRWMPGFGISLEECPHVRGRARTTWGRAMAQPRAFACCVPRRGTLGVETFVEPNLRGRVTFDVIRASTTFPFGIARKSVYFAAPRACLVRPRLLPLRDDLLARASGEDNRGRHPARSAGAGEEFFGVREYAAGDDPRSIAWRPTARTDQLIVRQTTVPAPTRLRLVLDAPSPEPDRSADETAISLAASLAVCAAARGMAVGLWIPASDVDIPARSSERGMGALLDALAAFDLDHAHAGSGPTSGAPRRGEATVVIHAGDGEWASGGGTTHFSAAHPEEYLGAGFEPDPIAPKGPGTLVGTVSARIGRFLWGDAE